MQSLNKTALAALLLIGLALPLSATAKDYSVGDIVVQQPWTRATPPQPPIGAGFMTLVNEGSEADRLVAASSPAAGVVEIHRTIKKDGMTTMEHQENGIAIPAGQQVKLAPGGYHLMLMQLKSPLKEGGRVPVTLRFERAGNVTVELSVKPLGAMGGGHGGH